MAVGGVDLSSRVGGVEAENEDADGQADAQQHQDDGPVGAPPANGGNEPGDAHAGEDAHGRAHGGGDADVGRGPLEPAVEHRGHDGVDAEAGANAHEQRGEIEHPHVLRQGGEGGAHGQQYGVEADEQPEVHSGQHPAGQGGGDRTRQHPDGGGRGHQDVGYVQRNAHGLQEKAEAADEHAKADAVIDGQPRQKDPVFPILRFHNDPHFLMFSNTYHKPEGQKK